MGGFSDASIWAKLAVLMSTCDTVYLLSGFASSVWIWGEEAGVTVSYGLWFRCVQPSNSTWDCLTYSTIDGQAQGYFSNLTAVRGLLFTSFICLLLCAFLGFLYIQIERLHHKWFAVFLAILAYTSVSTGFAGEITYGTNLVPPNFQLGWSFAFTILMSIFSVPIPIYYTVETIKSHSWSSQRTDA